jgi:hypothetical protein
MSDVDDDNDNDNDDDHDDKPNQSDQHGRETSQWE